MMLSFDEAPRDPEKPGADRPPIAPKGPEEAPRETKSRRTILLAMILGHDSVREPENESRA